MAYYDNDKIFKTKDEFLVYIIDCYYEEIMAFIYKSIRNYQDAEDIIQEAFLAFYKSIDKFRHESSIRTYLYKIAVNTMINFENKKKREKNKIISFFTGSNNNRENKIDTNIENMKNLEINDIIRVSLEGFPPKQKIILSLRLFKGLKIKEIAEIMEISEGNVKSQISTGLKKLQIKLADSGYGL